MTTVIPREIADQSILRVVFVAAAQPQDPLRLLARDLSSRRGRIAAAAIDRTHETDSVAIGVLNDRVAGTPESVIRRLARDMTSGGQASEGRVDGFGRGEGKADDGTDVGSVGRILAQHRWIVEFEDHAVVERDRCVASTRTGWPVTSIVDQLNAQKLIEGQRCLHVTSDHVDLVEPRGYVSHVADCCTRLWEPDCASFADLDDRGWERSSNGCQEVSRSVAVGLTPARWVECGRRNRVENPITLRRITSYGGALRACVAGHLTAARRMSRIRPVPPRNLCHLGRNWMVRERGTGQYEGRRRG